MSQEQAIRDFAEYLTTRDNGQSRPRWQKSVIKWVLNTNPTDLFFPKEFEGIIDDFNATQTPYRPSLGGPSLARAHQQPEEFNADGEVQSLDPTRRMRDLSTLHWSSTPINNPYNLG